MSPEIKAKYDSRVKDYIDSSNLREPEHIIVDNYVSNAVVGYYGLKTEDCYLHPDVYIETCSKWYSEFETDILLQPLANPMNFIWEMGSKTLFVSDDGVTVQHLENTPMMEDEYDALIANPIEYLANKFIPKKYEALHEDDETAYAKLKSGILAYKKDLDLIKKFAATVINTYGVIQPLGAKLYPPFDLIFDRLRGFKETMLDLRRRPEKVNEACNALLPLLMKPLDGVSGDFPNAFVFLHCPAFLRPKDFEKYFWPTFKKQLMYISEERKAKTLIVLQNDVDRYYDYFLELPKASLLLRPEYENPIEVKKRIGHHQTLVANYPIQYYRTKSKEECVDLAKKICDECAPGGGFIFAANKAMISTSDINKDNMQAVYKFVHEYK